MGNYRIIEYPFSGVHVGVAEYTAGPTGCTVFYFPQEVKVACDVRGGMPGTMMVGDGYADAIVWAGGSLLGLEAAAGVRAELFERSGCSTDLLPLVRSAIIHDFGPRDNVIYPDKELGRAALKAAKPNQFPIGQCGAGCSASTGKLVDPEFSSKGGQGAAFKQVADTKIIVFTLVNSLGVIIDKNNYVVSNNFERYKTRSDISRMFMRSEPLTMHFGKQLQGRNTTLTLLVTNQKLNESDLSLLARQVHTSMARAIQPFHSRLDGDVLFCATTDEVEDENLSVDLLGIIASDLAWDAVLNSIPKTSSL